MFQEGNLPDTDMVRAMAFNRLVDSLAQKLARKKAHCYFALTSVQN